jgi:hypothetical protein
MRAIVPADVSGSTYPTAIGAEVRSIDMNGASEAGYTQGACYAAHVNDGCYTVSINDGNWDFEPVWPGEQAIPPLQIYDTAGTVKDFPAENGRLKTTDGNIVGYGHQHAIVIKITASSALTFTLITRAIVEYLPDPYSMVYNMARPSPPPDYNALALYAKVVSTLPMAVPYSQNEGFWQDVWNFMKKVLGVVSSVAPTMGPIGQIVGAAAGGIHAVGSMIEQL